MMRLGLVAFVSAAAVFAAPAAAQDMDRMATEAFAAASDGDIRTIAGYLDAGLDVNYVRNGRSMLSAAVSSRRAEAVRFLLERGADPMITSFTPDVVGYDQPRPLIEHARKLGAPEIVALLEARLPAAARAARSAPTGAPAPRAAVTTPAAGIAGRFSAHWARPGAYAVGDKVLFSTSGGLDWRPGRISRVGTGDFDRKYLVVDDKHQGTDWVNWTQVTARSRQPYWTAYFVGDWSLHTGMSSVLRTDGRDVYNVVNGGMKLPPLRVNADGSYTWVTVEGKRIGGRWQPRPDVPGVVLMKGNKGLDWTLHNSSTVSTTDIHRQDELRLHNPGAMGSVGYRLSR
jgi:hypothetical protein